MIYARRSYLFPDPFPQKIDYVKVSGGAEYDRLRDIASRPRARLVHDPIWDLMRALPNGWTLRGWRRACRRRGVHLGRAGSRS